MQLSDVVDESQLQLPKLPLMVMPHDVMAASADPLVTEHVWVTPVCAQNTWLLCVPVQPMCVRFDRPQKRIVGMTGCSVLPTNETDVSRRRPVNSVSGMLLSTRDPVTAIVRAAVRSAKIVPGSDVTALMLCSDRSLTALSRPNSPTGKLVSTGKVDMLMVCSMLIRSNSVTGMLVRFAKLSSLTDVRLGQPANR